MLQATPSAARPRAEPATTVTGTALPEPSPCSGIPVAPRRIGGGLMMISAVFRLTGCDG